MHVKHVLFWNNYTNKQEMFRNSFWNFFGSFVPVLLTLNKIV